MLYLLCITLKILFLTICLFSKNIELRYYLIETRDTISEPHEYSKSTIKNVQDFGDSSTETSRSPKNYTEVNASSRNNELSGESPKLIQNDYEGSASSGESLKLSKNDSVDSASFRQHQKLSKNETEGNFKIEAGDVKFSPQSPSGDSKEREKFLNEIQQRRPGTKLVEGDMILDRNQQKLYGLKTLPQDYDEGYDQAKKRSQWPNRKLFYTFDKSVTKDFAKDIKLAVNDLADELKGCITFEEGGSVNRVIITASNNGTCFSDVGFIRTGENFIHLNEKECSDEGSIQHELIHSLGLFHQQSRRDRDDYITIKWKNIKTEPKNMTHNFLKQENSTSFNLPYDYSSIMHYDKIAFTKKRANPPLITIETKNPKNQDVIGRQSISPQDILQIKLFYGCTAVLEKFILMDNGYLCKDPWTPINTEEECIAAANYLDIEYGESWLGPGDFPNCLLADDGRRLVYFNKSPKANDTAVNKQYAGVCKGDDGSGYAPESGEGSSGSASWSGEKSSGSGSGPGEDSSGSTSGSGEDSSGSGITALWTQGKDVNCWSGCGKKGGLCITVCGPRGFCCRKGFNDCLEEANKVASSNHHSCVIQSDCMEMDTDYYFNDIVPIEQAPRAYSWQECSELCRNKYAKCKFWTLIVDKCLVKTSKDGKRNKQGAISGSRECGSNTTKSGSTRISSWKPRRRR